jgi:Putative restriction endonuclease
MQETVKRRATYADLEAAPPLLVAELLYGELVTHPRPTGTHAHSHFRLGSILGPPFDEMIGGPGGWRFLTEPELHLGGDVAVPELAGWRVERIPGPPDPDPLAPVKIRLVPDWVCEILSPSTEKYDRCEKREIYAEAGVTHLWLVDPRVHVVESFALENGRWLLVGSYTGDGDVRIAPFDVIEFRLGRLWPPDRSIPAPAKETL